MSKKLCLKCLRTLPLSDFNPGHGVYGRHHLCRTCQSERAQKYPETGREETVKPIVLLEGKNYHERGINRILVAHEERFRHDPERLSTEFILELCKRKKAGA